MKQQQQQQRKRTNQKDNQKNKVPEFVHSPAKFDFVPRPKLSAFWVATEKCKLVGGSLWKILSRTKHQPGECTTTMSDTSFQLASVWVRC